MAPSAAGPWRGWENSRPSVSSVSERRTHYIQGRMERGKGRESEGLRGFETVCFLCVGWMRKKKEVKKR